MKKTNDLPQGIFWRGNVLWIRYQNERGKIIKETTGQTSIQVAVRLYNKRKTEVAMAINFPTRAFNLVSLKTLFDYWWVNHAKHKPSKFEYLVPRLHKLLNSKARQITSDIVREFLNDLRFKEGLSASSVNHYRTILNSIFNYAIKNKKYDENPVRAVPTFPEPPGRDRFTTPEEIQKLLAKCEQEEDAGLKAFVIIAATTGLRKNSILPRKYTEVFLDENPHIYVGKTKNGDSIRIPLPEIAVEAIKSLSSYGRDEYLFPAKPNVRFQGNFKKPHAWDIGKRFRRICKLASITNLRIHDLRHFATTVLFMEGIPDAIIAKMTGHRSRELEKYKHLSPMFKKQTVEIIAQKLTKTEPSSDLVQ